MKKRIYLLVTLLFVTLATNAQLAVGDIAFIGYNTDSGPGTNDNFTFICLTDIPGSEVIYFGEEGWDNATGDWAGTSEGHLTYTAPAAGLPCGTIVNINEATSNVLTVTGGGTATLSSGSNWSLSGGDQVLAYQALVPEPGTPPTFIAGVHGDDGNGSPVTLDPITFWNDSAPTPLGTARSELPPGLTNGDDCVALFPAIGTEVDNAKYTGTLTGTSTFLRAEINDYTNWSSDNGTPYSITPGDYTASVTCVAPCSDPTVPTVTFSPATLCEGSTATLTISGTLNDATAWHIYTGSCGGTELGSTGGTTFDVTPGAPSTTYYVRGEGACVSPGSCGSVTITTTAVDDASFSFDAAAYCIDDSDPTPTITGVGGGSFSAGAGLSINASTGTIDVSASTPGTYTVTYTTTGTCPNSSSVSVTINTIDDASFSYGAATYCADDSDPSPTITGLAGGTFSSGAGLSINAATGTIDVSASTPGTYTITYTTTGSCPNSSSVSVTINALDDASFSYDAAAYCIDDSDPTPTISGLAGGSFSAGAGLSINASTGSIDVSVSTPGTYTVTYTTTGTCPNNSSVSVTINTIDDASFSYGAATYCADDTDPTPTITGLAGGSFSAGAGLSINVSTGTIDVSASTPGTYTVTYTTAGSCPNSSSVSVTITALDDATFSYDAAAYCVDDADPTPTISSPGGVFFAAGGLSLNITTGEIDVSASTPGLYLVTYATSGPCVNASGVFVTINALDDASFSYDMAAYCADALDPTPTITGLAGGTFSSGVGLSINASTGTIDLSASTAGTYTVTYTTAGSCPNNSSVSVTINALDDPAFNYDSPSYCISETDPTPTIVSPGGTFIAIPLGLVIDGTTGEIDVSASTPGTYTVHYFTSGACTATSNVTVTINTLDDASFNYDAAIYCPNGADPTPTITGVPGGTFSSGAGLSINATTGEIDLSASTEGTYTVTYTTIGLCSNSTDETITIEDNTDPIPDDAVLAAVTAECEVATLTDPTATDNCGGTVTVTHDATLPITDQGTTVVTWTYDDGNGNTTTQTQNIIIDDVTDPVPDDAVLTAVTAECEVATLTDPTATDNCGGIVTVTHDAILPITDQGTTIVTWTYDDGNGNTTTQTQNVIIDDVTDPEPIEPVLLDVNAECEVTSLTDPIGFDNCGGIVTVTSDAIFPITDQGTTTVTWTYDDGNGNTATQTQDVVIDDVTAPVIADCPSDLTFSVDTMVCSAFVTWVEPTVTDNCVGVTMTSSHSPGTIFPLGTTTVTYTATDVGLNETTCSFDIIVNSDLAITVDVTDELFGADGAIDVTVTGGEPTYLYDWDIDGTGDFDDTEDLTDLVVGTYVIVVEDHYGCTVTETVNVELACFLLDVTVSDYTICENDLLILDATSMSGADITWDGGAIDGVGFMPGVVGTITYTATSADPEDCPFSVDIEVLAAPIVVASAGDGEICDGESVVLAASGDADTFVWDPLDLSPPIGVTTYTLIGTYDETGCSNTSEIDITVHALPDVVANADNVTICTGLEVTLFGSGASDYSWSPPFVIDGEPFIPAELGTTTYGVVGVDENGCSNSDAIDITVVEEIVITYTTTDEMFGSDGAINITVTGGLPTYVFDWDNDETGDFDDDEDLTGITSGFYEVVVQGEAGCSSSELIFLDRQLGIDENSASFQIYPNPTTEVITIAINGEFGYQVYSLDGNLLLNGTGFNTETVSLENVADGTYLIRVEANGTIQYEQIVKN